MESMCGAGTYPGGEFLVYEACDLAQAASIATPLNPLETSELASFERLNAPCYRPEKMLLVIALTQDLGASVPAARVPPFTAFS